MSQDTKTTNRPVPKPPSPVDALLDDAKPADAAWLSADVEPFVPSFLRSRNTTNPYETSPALSHSPSEMPTAGGRGRGRGGAKRHAHSSSRGGGGNHAGRGRGKHRGGGAYGPASASSNSFSWEAFFAQMQPDDVEMLVELLPPDVQMSYYHILEERSSLDGSSHAKDNTHRKNRNEIDKKHSNCFVAAVYETFQQLSPEELRDIQETLLCASADAFFLDDGSESLFVNGDEEMRPDEEEWLMEQMINEGRSNAPEKGNHP